MLLPPNVTAVIQPMDQNPIRLVKLGYRSKLLCNIVAQEHLPIELTLKTHSIRDAIMLLKSAWDELPQTVLINAWNKIRKWVDHEFDEEDNIPLAQLIQTNDDYTKILQEVSLLLEKLGNNTVIGSEDIENWNDDKETADEIEMLSDTSDEEEVEFSQEPKVTYAEAVQSVNNLILWFKTANDTNQVSQLINCRAKMVANYMAKEKKQTNIKHFFSSQQI